MGHGLTVCVLAGLVAVCSSVEAKTPASLVSDLAGILPAGKKARFAWSSGGNIADYRSGTKIKVTDSETGVIRELAPGTTGRTFGRLYHPHITFDGKRVIFTDQDAMAIWVINWDGAASSLRQVTGGYGSDYYYDVATQTDWIVRNDGPSFTGNLKRVNIDATSSAVSIWSNPGNIMGDADDGIGLSPDGLYVCSYWNTNEGSPEFGPCAILISSRARTCAADYPGNRGCVLSMAPDNHDIMHQSGPHISVQGYSGTNGAKIFDIDITTPIKTWAQGSNRMNTCAPGQVHDATRWASTDRNYVSSMMEFTNVNPFLIKLSTPVQWVAIDSQSVCNQCNSDMDVRFADNWSVTSVSETVPRLSSGLRGAHSEGFGINGRRLSPAARRYGGGIVIQRNEMGATLRAEVVR